MNIKIALLSALVLGLWACNEDKEPQKKGFQGGARQLPPQQQPPVQTNAGNAGTRGDAIVDYQGDDPKLYVDMNVFYNGQHAGDDALFTFWIQRIRPAPQRNLQELLKTRGEKTDANNVVKKGCRCGKVNQYYFYWQHQHGRRGSLHNPVYNSDVRLQGDWILAHQVSDSNWYSGNVTSAQPGKHSMFLGADTENPAALFETNPDGNGYLRTWHYMPNSVLPFFGGDKEHKWENRDDMRLALTCDINKCPANLKDGTAIEMRHHYSHKVEWLLPPGVR